MRADTKQPNTIKTCKCESLKSLNTTAEVNRINLKQPLCFILYSSVKKVRKEESSALNLFLQPLPLWLSSCTIPVCFGHWYVFRGLKITRIKEKYIGGIQKMLNITELQFYHQKLKPLLSHSENRTIFSLWAAVWGSVSLTGKLRWAADELCRRRCDCAEVFWGLVGFKRRWERPAEPHMRSIKGLILKTSPSRAVSKILISVLKYWCLLDY